MSRHSSVPMLQGIVDSLFPGSKKAHKTTGDTTQSEGMTASGPTARVAKTPSIRSEIVAPTAKDMSVEKECGKQESNRSYAAVAAYRSGKDGVVHDPATSTVEPHSRAATAHCSSHTENTAQKTPERPQCEKNELRDHPRNIEGRDKTLEAENETQSAYARTLAAERNSLYDNVRLLETAFKDLRRKNGSLESEHKKLLRDFNHVASRYDHIVRHYIKPYAKEIDMQWKDTSVASIANVLKPLRQNARSAPELRSHLQSLQKGMLANVDKIQPVNDEIFKQDFRGLAATIKTLSREIKFDPNVDMVKIFTPSVLVSEVQEKYWLARPRKKMLIETVIWSVLIKHVFANPFSVFGERYHSALSELYSSMFGKAHDHEWPLPSELAERWRYTTVEQLAGAVGTDVIKSGKKQNMDVSLESSVLQARKKLDGWIAYLLTQLSTSASQSLVDGIVDKAYALALQMALQRSRIQVVHPEFGDPFCVDQSDGLSSIPDCEDVEEGSVAFTVNPGLTKWGDGYGKNLNERLVLVPAEVFVEPWITDKVNTTKGNDAIFQKEDITID